MSTDFIDTDKKEEPKTIDIKLPTLDILGMKIKMDDAQNALLILLAVGTGAMAINTFAPRLNPFNKPKEEPKKEEKATKPEKEVKKQTIPDVIEYEPMETLDLDNDNDNEGISEIVDRLYDDPDTIVKDYNPSKKLTYKEIDETIFGNEKKVLKKKIPTLSVLGENKNLEISSDLS